jgi:Tfp pilus assembly protein PilF
VRFRNEGSLRKAHSRFKKALKYKDDFDLARRNLADVHMKMAEKMFLAGNIQGGGSELALAKEQLNILRSKKSALTVKNLEAGIDALGKKWGINE